MRKRQFEPKVRRHIKHSSPTDDTLKLSEKFSKAVKDELDDFVKASALFGSCAVGGDSEKSDIDILFIIDDVKYTITPEITRHYRDVISSAAGKHSELLHVNTLRLSNFWEYCRAGDPVIINMLRDGHILFDDGFFGPAQLLLQQGRIRPTRESVWSYYGRTTNTLRSAQKHMLSACVDLYWAAIDAAHAALMSVGETPPSPEHIADLLDKRLVKKGMLGKQYPVIMRELYHLQKGISHRDIKEITGEQYEGYWAETLRLVHALRTVVESNMPNR